jgi:hypothetical protein
MTIKEKTVKELLDDLQSVVDLLKASLPKQAPLVFSTSIDPLRALHLREACMHRITELVESACKAFNQGNNVSGYILARAIFETFALFWYFIDAVKKGLQYRDIEELRKILTRMLIGSKAEPSKENVRRAFREEGEGIAEGRLEPIHVATLIDHVKKQIPPFEDHYNFLCEIAHPNAMGLIRAYVKNDWDKQVTHFGKEHGSFGGHLESDLGALVISLESFIELYKESAGVLGCICQVLEN